MHQFGTDSPRRTRAIDAGDTAPEEAPTVKIRAARALPQSTESSERMKVAKPVRGGAGS